MLEDLGRADRIGDDLEDLIPRDPRKTRFGIASDRFVLVPAEDEDPSRESPLERAAAELSDEATDRLEARAYVEVMDLVERLGGRGSAPAVVRVLERRLEDR